MLKKHIAHARSILTLAAALAMPGCGESAEPVESGPSPANGGNTGGKPMSGTNGGSNATNGNGTGGTNTGGDSQGSAAKLPYPVDTDFVASGYMGDTTGIEAAPSIEDDDRSCGGNPAPNANGSICHTFTYTPSGGQDAWAGVYWQYPVNNWSAPGLPMEAGAQKVTFYARAEKPITVEFIAGMDPGPDGFKISSMQPLTDTWTAFEIDLSKVTYTSVAGAFGWALDSTAQTETGPFTLYIDAVTWTK